MVIGGGKVGGSRAVGVVGDSFDNGILSYGLSERRNRPISNKPYGNIMRYNRKV